MAEALAPLVYRAWRAVSRAVSALTLSVLELAALTPASSARVSAFRASAPALVTWAWAWAMATGANAAMAALETPSIALMAARPLATDSRWTARCGLRTLQGGGQEAGLRVERCRVHPLFSRDGGLYDVQGRVPDLQVDVTLCGCGGGGGDVLLDRAHDSHQLGKGDFRESAVVWSSPVDYLCLFFSLFLPYEALCGSVSYALRKDRLHEEAPL